MSAEVTRGCRTAADALTGVPSVQKSVFSISERKSNNNEDLRNHMRIQSVP